MNCFHSFVFTALFLALAVSCQSSTGQQNAYAPKEDDLFPWKDEGKINETEPKTLEDAYHLVHEADSLMRTSGWHHDDYFEVRWKYHEASEIFSERIGKDTFDYAKAKSAEGDCICFLIDSINPPDEPDAEEAVDCYDEALTILESTVGKHHPEFLKAQFGRTFCKWQGYDNWYARDDVAKKDVMDALTLMKKRSDCREYYLRGLNLIGGSYFGKDYYYYSSTDEDGFANSLSYYAELAGALEVSPSHYEDLYIRTLYRLGRASHETADFQTALAYFKQALAEEEQSFGRGRYYYKILSNIGDCYLSQKDYGNAFDALQEAYTGDPNATIGGDLAYSLGMCCYYQGRYDDAIRFFKHSDEEWGEVPSYGAGLHNATDMIGICYMKNGDYPAAIENFESSLQWRKGFGIGHPLVNLDWNGFGIDDSQVIHNLGICYDKLDQLKASGALYESYYDVIARAFREEFSYSIDKATRIWEHYSSYFYEELPYITFRQAKNVPFLQAAYNGILFSKGLLLNTETNLRNLILESKDPVALELYDGRQRLKERRDSLSRMGRDEETLQEIEMIQGEIDEISAQLTSISKPFGDYTRNLAIGWEQVRSFLGRKDIAIEFLEVPLPSGKTLYCALTLKRDYDAPHYVALFDLADLDALKKDYTRLGTLDSDIYDDTELYDLVWKPLKKELRDVDNIYFGPSGELYQLAIEYANTGKGPLSDRLGIHRLSSTRQLAASRGNQFTKKAAVFGGFEYGVSEDVLVADSRKYRRIEMKSDMLFNVDSLNLRGAARSDYGVSDLAGTEEEAKAIESQLRSSGIETLLVTGKDGTETAFKDLSARRESIIHIATHGFYWDGKRARQIGEDLGRLELVSNPEERQEDASMTRSGLLFSGANNALRKGYREVPGVDDGILTASEIAQLDLRGANLLVLSACQTGLGEISGDGVFGLQRGFKKAGVESILMSLWEVDDEATQLLMTSFYKNMVDGMSKSNALRAAQNTVKDYEGQVFSSPFYWAAFILLDALD